MLTMHTPARALMYGPQAYREGTNYHPSRALHHERHECDATVCPVAWAAWDAAIDAEAARFDWLEGGFQRTREAVGR